MTFIYTGSNGPLRTQNAHKTLALHVVHKVAPVSQWGPRLPIKARSTCGSHSGSYGSLGTQNACKDIDLPVVHTAAPAAHWGPRTHKMARSIWRWCKMVPGAHWGPIMTGIIWIYKSFMEWLSGLSGDQEGLQWLNLHAIYVKSI